MLKELEKAEVLNAVLDDENIGGFRSNATIFDSEYTQLVTPGTHVISDSESDNGSDKQDVNVGSGEVSHKFVWQNIHSFPA